MFLPAAALASPSGGHGDPVAPLTLALVLVLAMVILTTLLTPFALKASLGRKRSAAQK